MHKYIGIDLHSNNSVVVVTDEADRIIFQKRLANSLNEILPVLEPHRDESVGVVVESTYNWYWLVDGLMDAGYQVHLAHPSAIKKYEGLKYSGDFADATLWDVRYIVKRTDGGSDAASNLRMHHLNCRRNH